MSIFKKIKIAFFGLLIVGFFLPLVSEAKVLVLVSEVSATSTFVTIKGNLSFTDPLHETIPQHFYLYLIKSGGTLMQQEVTITNQNGYRSFIATRAELTPATQYAYRITDASSKDGPYTVQEVIDVFTTSATGGGVTLSESDPPTVTTKPVINVYVNEVTAMGNVLNNNNPSKVWFKYGDSTSNLDATTTKQNQAHDGDFNTVIGTYHNAPLVEKTMYYYKACAENTKGEACGSVDSFAPKKTHDPVIVTGIPPGAPTQTSYNLLAVIDPSNTVCIPDPSGKTDCIETNQIDTTTGFGPYLNTLIKIFIGLCAVLAMVMIVYGGIEYMTGELISEKADGKGKIMNAIFGLILALGAYAILNTINPDLLDVSLGNMPVAELDVDDSTPQTAIGGKFCTKTAGTNGGYDSGANWNDTLAGAITALPAGVITNHPGADCAKVGDHGCTSLRGLHMDRVQAIKNSCANCVIVITAGTECWEHGGPKQSTNHHPGSTTVDLRATPSLNKFFTDTEDPVFDNKPYTKGGVTCKAEPKGGGSSEKHWHCN